MKCLGGLKHENTDNSRSNPSLGLYFDHGASWRSGDRKPACTRYDELEQVTLKQKLNIYVSI